MNVEKILIDRIGDVGKKLHTGRSRNDQVALDLRMYLRDEIREIKGMLLELLAVLLEISEKEYGYDHAGIYASPESPTCDTGSPHHGIFPDVQARCGKAG